MQWEFTSSSTNNNSAAEASTSIAAQQDVPIEDESMRDASMLSPHDDEQEQQPMRSATPTPAQAVTKRNRNRRGSSSSIQSISRNEDRPSSSSSLSHPQQQHQQQWPLAPVVGTVINYLVPPLPPQKEASSIDSALTQPVPSRRSRATSQAERAHSTLHPREKPLLLLSYFQLTFNASLLLLAGYIVFALVYTIRLDVTERLSEIEESYHASLATCRRSFELNCLSVPLPPALVQACEGWEQCANKRLTDVLGGSRLRVVIEVLSEAWEAGVAGLGWRTLAFSLLVLSLVIGGTNSTLNSWRLGVMKKSRRERKEGSKRRQQVADGSDDEDSFVAPSGTSTATPALQLPPPPSMPAYPASFPTSPNGMHPAYHHQQYLAAQHYQQFGSPNPYAQQQYMAPPGMSYSPPSSPLRKQPSNVSLRSDAGSAGSGGSDGGRKKGKRKTGWMAGMLGRKGSNAAKARRARLAGAAAASLGPPAGQSSGGEWVDE